MHWSSPPRNLMADHGSIDDTEEPTSGSVSTQVGSPGLRPSHVRVSRRWSTPSSGTVLGFALVTPALLLAFVFKFVPLFLGMYQSTRRWRGASPEHVGVGLENYRRLLEDQATRTAFKNAFFVLLTLPVWVLVPLVLAVMINEKTPGWKFFRSVFFLPYIIAPIIVGLIFRQILAPDGVINVILERVGLESLARPWLAHPTTALAVLILVALWSFFGFGVLTYLAGLATIDSDMLDAAAVDGAGFWKRLVHVVVPSIRDVIGYWTVLTTAGMLIWMFPLIFALTQGGPGYGTMMPEFLVFITTFQFLNRGFGTAIGMTLFALVAVLSIATVRSLYTRAKHGGA